MCEFFNNDPLVYGKGGVPKRNYHIGSRSQGHAGAVRRGFTGEFNQNLESLPNTGRILPASGFGRHGFG